MNQENNITLTAKQAKLLSFYINDLTRYLNVAEENQTNKRGRGGNQADKSESEQWLESLKTITNKLREDYMKGLDD